MGFFFHNIGWKILSLAVAFALWLLVMSSNSIEISKEVQLDIDTPAELVVANEVPDRVTFRLSGSKFFLRTVANSLDSIKVDLSRAKAGPAFYRIDRDALRLPIGVKVLSISPSNITPVLEQVQRRNVPVQVIAKNKVPGGYRLLKLQAVPPTVRLRGPKSLVEKISVVRADPVDLTDIPASLKWELPVSTGDARVRFEEENAPKVVVEVEPTGSNFRVAGVPLKVESSRRAVANVDRVALYVSCPPRLIRSITPDKVSAVVRLTETQPGTYVREVTVQLPEGVKLVRVVPDRVQLQVD